MSPIYAAPARRRALLRAILVLLLLPAPCRARAASPPDDEPTVLAPRIERLDDAPHELWTLSPAEPPGRRAPLWIALQAGVVDLSSGERSFTAMVLAGIPLERFAPRPHARISPHFAEGAAPQLKPPPASPQPPPSPQPPASREPEPEPEPAVSPALPVRITPDVARAAVAAALRRARLLDPEARVDALASRARTSALLPQLRLRVSRLVDEEQRLAPTEADPGRTTASGGASLWLEARATWRLDRIVFADEEVALERLRRERAQAQGKLVKRVLDLLFAWQRALARASDPAQSPEEQLASTLDQIEAEASIDLITGGWFTRWRRGSVRRDPPR